VYALDIYYLGKPSAPGTADIRVSYSRALTTTTSLKANCEINV
jgi:hypothetical protein